MLISSNEWLGSLTEVSHRRAQMASTKHPENFDQDRASPERNKIENEDNPTKRKKGMLNSHEVRFNKV